ncbi:FAD-binding domain-containing protein [Xylariaceae sp. FL1019]|nr:FAD-binding domain-containing protein [Xylariaceae sp. FL1019]
MPFSCAKSCCSALSSALGSKVYFPGDSVYNGTEQSYWSTQEALLTPSCVVKPEVSTDVAKFMSVVTEITNCSFAIRTQGHSPAAGTANIQNGVTLDLTYLNSTTISEDQSVARVETGSRWVDVYKTLDPYNKTVNGGRNGGVGVGGLTLGGGISHFSPQVGFTCDTVQNFEIVLADASTVNANATSNSDLFRALKGGGNNFGVVTRIDYRTVDITDVRGGLLFQTGDYAEAILTAFGKIAASDDFDVHTSLVTDFLYNSTSKEWLALSIPIYTLPELNPPVYRELFAIPNITTETTSIIESVAALADEAPIAQKYQTFYTSTYAASPELLVALFNVANETLYSLDIPADVTWSITFEPFPTVFTKQGEGDNVLGTSEAEGNAVILLAGASWTEPSSSEIGQSLAPLVVRAMDDAAAEAGGLHRFKYMNYADPKQKVFQSYGEANAKFLKDTSRKYDPKRIFQRQVPGGFKLGL